MNPWFLDKLFGRGPYPRESVGSDPLGAHPRHDTSYSARQARLDALPEPKVRTTSDPGSGEKSETPAERAARQLDKNLRFMERYSGDVSWLRYGPMPQTTINEEEPMYEHPDKAVNRAWAPDYLVRALFQQDKNWIKANGDEVKIAEMDRSHALSVLLFMERVADDFPFDRNQLQSQPLYQALKARVESAWTGATAAKTDVPMSHVSRLRSAMAPAALRTLRLDYTNSNGERTVRHIVPLRFNNVLDRDRVIARDVDKNELRSFRLDRINSLSEIR